VFANPGGRSVGGATQAIQVAASTGCHKPCNGDRQVSFDMRAPSGGLAPQPGVGIAAQPLLEIESLSVEFEAHDGSVVRVVDEVSFSMRPGEIVGVVGESGSGKSSLGLALVGALPGNARVSCDRLVIAGTDMSAASAEEWRNARGHKIGFVPQGAFAALNPVRKVRSQTREMRRGKSVDDIDAAALQWFEQLGISDASRVLKAYPHELSGGLRQRVVTATVQLGEPDLVIADEPTTALDAINQAQFLERLRAVRDQSNAGLLVITHDMGVIAEICDSVIVMYAGMIVERGPIEGVFTYSSHPYTKALMGCVPELGNRPTRLTTIPGEHPQPGKRHEGCPFAPRCPERMDLCTRSRPTPVTIGEGHHASCWAVPRSAPAASDD
jgi:oligopeptide/dipeptide ABC transporter ATP-binding protein